MQSEKLGEPRRLVIDESSFSFHDVDDIEVEYAIDDFNDLLSEILRSGITVAKFSCCLDVECRTGLPLYKLLYEQAAAIDAETLRRCSALLDRCTDWDEEVDDVSTICKVAGEQVESWSLGYAIMRSSTHFMACLVCSTAGRRGLLTVSAGDLSGEIYFLAEASSLVEYWQLTLTREKIRIENFFSIANHAFPHLAFHSDLDFRKFRGGYEEVYDWVVQTFTVLNNFLGQSFEARKGVRHLVQRDMASHGLEISPESSQTHKNRKAAGQRVVKHSGELHLCEWHAKRLWNTDRIHFTTPGSLSDGRTLIGIFVQHLDT
ncbi:hypothetical protein PSH03_001990 [Micromonospora sp. PSH03]|uniref:hypothetical protein n=1 Tax=Micromonospora salmantinae TaxID=2911211 RepID=UPI001EE949C8|nr:hypothetical protein [Micromonospora salmantinae]MCG5457083.1 hypothetical protein [Micromonospora salmantinae]